MVAPLEHGYLRSGASGNVRKLGGDVTAANQHDPPRQALKLQKAVTGDNVFRAGKPQRHRTRAGSNKDMTRLELLSCDGNCVGASEPRKAVKSINGLGTTQEHFLGITSAQCTSSAERTMIHDGNRSTRLSDPRARDLSGGARSNHHQVIHFHFEPPAAPKGQARP